LTYAAKILDVVYEDSLVAPQEGAEEFGKSVKFIQTLKEEEEEYADQHFDGARVVMLLFGAAGMNQVMRTRKRPKQQLQFRPKAEISVHCRNRISANPKISAETDYKRAQNRSTQHKIVYYLRFPGWSLSKQTTLSVYVLT
jgi:hypothetical protein